MHIPTTLHHFSSLFCPLSSSSDVFCLFSVGFICFVLFIRLFEVPTSRCRVRGGRYYRSKQMRRPSPSLPPLRVENKPIGGPRSRMSWQVVQISKRRSLPPKRTAQQYMFFFSPPPLNFATHHTIFRFFTWKLLSNNLSAIQNRPACNPPWLVYSSVTMTPCCTMHTVLSHPPAGAGLQGRALQAPRPFCYTYPVYRQTRFTDQE